MIETYPSYETQMFDNCKYVRIVAILDVGAYMSLCNAAKVAGDLMLPILAQNLLEVFTVNEENSAVSNTHPLKVTLFNGAKQSPENTAIFLTTGQLL